MKVNFSSEGMFKKYLIGFLLCVALTLAAYFPVVERMFSTETLLYLIIGLALVQAGVQLVCFLNLGRESDSHWNVTIFVFAVIVVLMVVLGSLWIMYHLDYRLMPTEAELHQIHQQGL